MADEKAKKGAAPVVPFGPFVLSEMPADYKSLDGHIVDQILAVADKFDKAPLKDERNRTKIEWKSNGSKNGVEMSWAQTPGISNYFFRGVGIVPINVRTVENSMRQISNMRIIDPMCKETRMIKEYDRDHHIYYARFKLGFPISDRDMVWWSVDHVLADGTYVTTGKSIITPDCPDTPSVVRGTIRASGYICEGISKEETRVTYVVQADVKGWLPTWAVNWTAASQAYNPGVIRDQLPVFKEQMRKAEEAKKKADAAAPAPAPAPVPAAAAPAPAPANANANAAGDAAAAPVSVAAVADAAAPAASVEPAKA